MSVMTDEENRGWNTEKKAILNMAYFNFLLLVYNALFIIYSSIALDQENDDLMFFLPALIMFQTLIMTNFTLRYFKLARVMYIFFNSDIMKTLKASTPQAIQRNKRIIWAIEGMIYIITISSTACAIYGDYCIKNAAPDE